MSTSFGQCESSMGTTENNFYNNLWSQAATQGITSFVSSGDSGAAGCNGGNDTTGSGAAVSGLASTPYNVGVGGTQFNDTASPSTYWSSTNNGTNQSSVLSYIPEIAWNESANVTGGSGLWASSGGKSNVYTKPSWQVSSNTLGLSTFTTIRSSHGRLLDQRSNIIATPSVVRMCASSRKVYGSVWGMFLLL